MNSPHVAITGVGVLSPLGTGFGRFHGEDSATGPCAFDVAEWLGPKGLQFLDRSARMALSAVTIALRDAGFPVRRSDDPCDEATIADLRSTASAEFAPRGRDRVGLVLGSTLGFFASNAEFTRSVMTKGPRYVSPMTFPNTIIGSPAAQVSVRLGIRGPCLTLSNGHGSGADAVLTACDLLMNGDADLMVAAGVETLSESYLGACRALGWPEEKASEGAAAVVLERLDDAYERGRAVLAQILGGRPSRASLARFPDPAERLSEDLRQALGCCPARPMVVSAALGSSPYDAIEAEALERAGPLRGARILYPKKHCGETFSASGAIAVGLAASRLSSLDEADASALVIASGPDSSVALVILGRGEPCARA